jgi:hypothetical protein
MSNKNEELRRRLVTAVYEGEGVTEPSLRITIKDTMADGRDLLNGTDNGIPDDLNSYLHKIKRYAYKVTDKEVEELKARGYSEDAIFEITVSAAVGAGLSRLERGMAALNGKRID